MKHKILIISALSVLFLVSCTGMVKTKTTKSDEQNTDTTVQMNQDQKEKTSPWWQGKRFENNLPVSNNPEEGGPDFLIINQDQTASYKVGDIIDVMTWKVSEDTITFKNKLTEREIIFKISDSFLTDSYDTKWTVRESN